MIRRFTIVVLLIIAANKSRRCYGFSTKRTEAGWSAMLSPLWLGNDRISNTELQNDSLRDTRAATIAEAVSQNQLHRRKFFSQVLCSISGGSLALCAFSNPAQAEFSPTRIVRLSSGLQFSDQRVGSGPFVPIPKTMTGSIDKTEGLEPDDPTVVLMHLRALKQDGSVLLDTYEEKKPLLFRLGSIPSEIYYLYEGGAMAKGKIPLGVQDAILAQGAASWEGGFGKADPMRTGGIRKVVVPSELAYGSKGVSRYEAFQLGLKQPVAVNELLRYEIEILRCNDEVMDLAGKSDAQEPKPVTARACCPEELYPCQVGGGG